jgi:glycosyltransferase involved in cell wall biosynthesis
MVDGVICHSEHIKARLSEEFFVDRETVAVIPHGPFFYDLPLSHSGDVLRRLGVDETKTLVLWQGIIFPYKGIDLLLDAWRTVELNDPDAVLIIAGTGAPELLRQIEQEIASNELHHVMTHFRFVTTEELVALYRVADVVVYPYRAISTSGALATGLALGKCIIASNLPVFRELLVSGTNALLVNPMDREELAAALLNVIADPELRARLSERVTAMNFGDASWHAIALETRLVYGYLLLRLNVI